MYKSNWRIERENNNNSASWRIIGSVILAMIAVPALWVFVWGLWAVFGL